MENNRFVYVTSIVIYSSRTIDTHTYNHKHTLSTHTQTNTYFRKILKGFVSNNGHDRFSTPPPPPPPQVSQINTQVVPLWLVPNNQADSSFLHRVPPVRGGGGGGGGVQLNQHDDDNKGNVMQQNWTVNRARKSFKEKYMANKRTNSVNSAFGEGTRRCFSFVNSSGPTQTGCRRSTLNPDGGWTISTWSVSLPTIMGGRDLCIWLPCKSWYKNCTLASIPKPLKFLRPHYPLLKVMYELAGTIAKSTTHNQGQGGITRSRMSQPCYDRYDPYDEES